MCAGERAGDARTRNAGVMKNKCVEIVLYRYVNETKRLLKWTGRTVQ